MKKLLQKIALLTAGFTMLFAFTAVPAMAATKDDVCAGVGLASGTTGCGSKDDAEKQVSGVIATVINLISIIVGIAAIIMIIIGGFKYIISSGDASNITSAKNTILYALIGLAVAALAQVIVRFVLNKL